MNQGLPSPIPIWKFAKTDCHFQEGDSKELSLIECFFLLFLVPLLSPPQAWLLPLSPRWAWMSLLLLRLGLGEYSLWWLWSWWPTGLWLQLKLWLTLLQYLQEWETYSYYCIHSWSLDWRVPVCLVWQRGLTDYSFKIKLTIAKMVVTRVWTLIAATTLNQNLLHILFTTMHWLNVAYASFPFHENMWMLHKIRRNWQNIGGVLPLGEGEHVHVSSSAQSLQSL